MHIFAYSFKMKYSNATGSPFNIVVKICQNNSATSPVIYPQSRRIFVVRKNRKKTSPWISFTSTLLYILHWKYFPCVCLLHPKSKKARLGPSPVLPEEMTALENLRYKFELHSIVNKATLVSFLYLLSKYVYFCNQKRFALTSYVSLISLMTPLGFIDLRNKNVCRE